MRHLQGVMRAVINAPTLLLNRKRTPNPRVPNASYLGLACADELNGTVLKASWSC